ncbi:MAG: PAS domain S-box protein [Pirellulales bacterium]
MIATGQDTDNQLHEIVAIQRQCLVDSTPLAAVERALRWLSDQTQSESAIVWTCPPNSNGCPPSNVYAAVNVAAKNGRLSARRPASSEAFAERVRELLAEQFGAAGDKPVCFETSAASSTKKSSDVLSDVSLCNGCGLQLRDDSGAIVGVVALVNRPSGFDRALIDKLRPMCDALAALLQSAQREHAHLAREAVLEASEARLRIFADHVTDGLFLQDAETRVVDVNRRGCETLGYTRDELIGMTPANFDTAITEEEIKSYSARLAAGESIAFDSRHCRKDGVEYPVEIRVSPVWIGGKLHTLALVCDITERKRAEERLRQSEERLELALIASRMGVWEWDMQSDETFWSPECYDIYGEKNFDGRGASFTKMIHPEDLDPLGEVIQKALDSETFSQWEFRFTPSDGRTRWIANWAMVRRDASGKPIKLLGTARDITEQKRAEDALRQSTLLLENIVENIPLAVFVKDPKDEFRIRLWNKAAESIFGIPREEMIGRNSADYWPKHMADSYLAIDEKVMREGRMQVVEEEQSTTREGGAITVHTRKLPLCDRDGKPTLLLAICEDISARKRSAEALKEAQHRLAFTLRGADVGLWDWDLKTNEVIFSEEWKSQLGYHGDEIRNINLEWESRVHPEDLPIAQQNVENAVLKRTPEYRSEFRMRHKDGSWRWILSRGSLIDDAQGRPARLMGIHIDITERKRAEEALQASESRYRTFVDHATDALFLQDQEGRVVDVNEQACVSLGYTRDELIGKMPYEFDPDVTPEYVAETVKRLDAGEVLAFDSRHQGKDGSTFPVEIRLRPFWVNNQRFHVALVRDITERKRNEETLRESESRLRTLLENLDKVAVQAYEPDGTITFWNRASELFYGYTADQALGRDLIELLHGEHTRAGERKIMAQALQTGKPPGAEEVEVVRQDGAKLTVFASRVVHPRAGRQPEFFCFDVDITDRKRAEEELALRQTELLHASRLSTVGQMVAEISHEVAQPLNAIGNFAAASEKILEGGVDGQLSTLYEYIRAILDQNQRCVTILGRLRDFSRRSPGTHANCDVCQLLHESCDLMSFELRRSRIRVSFELPKVLPPIRGDRIQLQQLVVNLLTNARDALVEQSDSRRTIAIRAAAEFDSVVFEVEDTGSGLSDEAKIHLFDPFFTTKRHGMGIGLSICQSIAKEHGGRIDAVTNAHGGATFRVRLPISRK